MPISSWLYSLAVARFIVRQAGVVRGVALSYWAFPQDEVKNLAALEQDARGSFEFFRITWARTRIRDLRTWKQPAWAAARGGRATRRSRPTSETQPCSSISYRPAEIAVP